LIDRDRLGSGDDLQFRDPRYEQQYLGGPLHPQDQHQPGLCQVKRIIHGIFRIMQKLQEEIWGMKEHKRHAGVDYKMRR
jgi:hypothetical protein